MYPAVADRGVDYLAGVDVLATVYHACHRELCAYDDGRPFEILNVMSLVAESLGN